MSHRNGQNYSIMMAIFIGYMIHIYNKRNLIFLYPDLMKEFDFDQKDVGLISSSQKVSTTIGALIAGILIDRFDPESLFILGLIISGSFTLLFVLGSTIHYFMFIWFLNGFGHSLMLPTAIFYVKNFSHPKRFALNWSFVSISVNVAGIINPLLTTWLNAKFGWRFAVNFSGTITLATGISIWLLCGNKNRQIESKKCDDTKSSEPQKPQRLNFSIFQNMIFIIISLIAINRFVVILIRSSIHDWTQLIFVNDLNLTLNQSSLFVSTMETSSIIGKLISGYLNDLVGSNSRSKISNRASLSIVWHLLSSLSLLFYFQLNASSSLISLLLIASMIGCSTSANVITLNIFSTEISSVTETNTKRSVGHKGLFMSITNMASQFGAFLSGYPITIMSSTLGWSQTFFSIQIIISMIIIFDLIFIWKQRYDAIKNKSNNVLVETF